MFTPVFTQSPSLYFFYNKKAFMYWHSIHKGYKFLLLIQLIFIIISLSIN
nr:MAG TPA: hypothetical protein [Caudoviricetes sp.]